MSARSVGLLGGTFDPIHYGHLLLAEEARTQFDLDCVLFIPNYLPPHKTQGDDQSSGAEDRHTMCILATLSNPFFKVSRIELDRGGVSYTFDTLQELKKEHPENRYYFICGADSVAGYTWHRFEELVRMLEGLLIASREGAGLQEARRKVKQEFPGCLGKLRDIKMETIEISATRIRERVRQGKTIRYLVPEGVAQFIEQYKLYLKEH